MDQVSDVLWSNLSSKHLTFPDHDRFLVIAVKFRERLSFPNVIGCTDGKHIRIKCPTRAGSLFYNYKQFFFRSITGSESRFIFIDLGAYGKQSGGGTFSASTLYHFLEDSKSTLPKPASFVGSGTEVPFVILGDEAYPLKTYLMKPFARKDLSCEECVFNFRLSRARRCECAIGIQTAKWRLLKKAVETNVNKDEGIVRCICLLHNIIIDLEGTTQVPSQLQETSQIRGSHQARTNVSGRSFSRSSKGAIDVRNAFKAYSSGPTAAILSQNH